MRSTRAGVGRVALQLIDEEGGVPCVSWCLDGSLKPFHHDLRSRLFWGDAALLI